MRQVEATTTQQLRRAVTAAAPASAAPRTPWLASPVSGLTMRPTAMHTKVICRRPEAPT